MHPNPINHRKQLHSATILTHDARHVPSYQGKQSTSITHTRSGAMQLCMLRDCALRAPTSIC